MLIDTAWPYEQPKQFNIHLGRENIDVVSKPGLADWDKLLPTTELLAENVILNPNDHVFLFGVHQGAMSVFIIRNLPDGILTITDRSSLALKLTCETLKANNLDEDISINRIKLISDVKISSSYMNKYDSVLIDLPKGRMLSRKWLLQAHHALKTNGNLYIAGANKSGIHSAIKDGMELFGNGRILAYKKGNRIACMTKKYGYSLPEWTHDPGVALGSWFLFSVSIYGRSFQITSLPGVFSYDHLDAGTKMLVSNIDIHPGARVLDVGCGYGIIGLCASALGAEWVDFIDEDLLATASCVETLSQNHVTNAAVFSGDLLEPIGKNKYDFILSNPPFHAGHKVDYQIASAMIRQSYASLHEGGLLAIVANRFLAYDRLIKEIFGNVNRLVESGKYYVLTGRKS